MNSDISVLPKEDTVIKIITKVKIQSVTVDLFSSATAFTILYDENNNIVKTQNITLSGEEYDAWLTDEYFENLILQKLGLEKATTYIHNN